MAHDSWAFYDGLPPSPPPPVAVLNLPTACVLPPTMIIMPTTRCFQASLDPPPPPTSRSEEQHDDVLANFDLPPPKTNTPLRMVRLSPAMMSMVAAEGVANSQLTRQFKHVLGLRHLSPEWNQAVVSQMRTCMATPGFHTMNNKAHIMMYDMDAVRRFEDLVGKMTLGFLKSNQLIIRFALRNCRHELLRYFIDEVGLDLADVVFHNSIVTGLRHIIKGRGDRLLTTLCLVPGSVLPGRLSPFPVFWCMTLHRCERDMLDFAMQRYHPSLSVFTIEKGSFSRKSKRRRRLTEMLPREDSPVSILVLAVIHDNVEVATYIVEQFALSWAQLIACDDVARYLAWHGTDTMKNALRLACNKY